MSYKGKIMELKWFAIMMVGIMATGMVALSVESYTDSKLSIESAKAGLEQCPNLNANNSHATIWVKDCKAFTETYYINKDK